MEAWRMRHRKELKEAALEIFQAGLDAVDPHDAVRRHLRMRDDELIVTKGEVRGAYTVGAGADYEKVLVVGAGKASARMCQAVEEVLGERIAGGLIITKTGHTVPTRYVEVVEASHPVPDEAGLEATKRLVELVQEAGDDTLIVVLISGGGSALLPLPAEGITLAEKQDVTNLLLKAGADIGEMNTLRKHLSSVKGGWLAAHAAPAPTVTLILSDVVGDQLDTIASGPTVPDASTYADALAVLERRDLVDKVPASVMDHLARGKRGEIDETPKEDAPVFENCRHVLVGNNGAALRACCRAAAGLGYEPLLLSSMVEGETREIAKMHAAIAREASRSGAPVAPPACIVSGGETTVTFEPGKSGGKGGRNQEFALAAAFEIADCEGIAILSAGTDGTDGPTDAAGAIVFGDSVSRGVSYTRHAREHLDGHDAYPFFSVLGDLIVTGPTHTNVMDIHLMLIADTAKKED